MLEEQVPEQPKDVVAHDERDGESTRALFTRPMPGRGSVRVELVVSDRGEVAGERLRGRVVLDDESLSDVVGGTMVVVEELEGDTVDDLVPELLRIARDNAAIARRVLRRRAARAD